MAELEYVADLMERAPSYTELEISERDAILTDIENLHAIEKGRQAIRGFLLYSGEDDDIRLHFDSEEPDAPGPELTEGLVIPIDSKLAESLAVQREQKLGIERNRK